MKKIVVFASIICFSISFISCKKKDYVCACTVGETTVTYTYKDITKREAKRTCVSWHNLYVVNYDGSSCELQ